MNSTTHLLRFLQEELSLSPASLELALRQTEQPAHLPMVLWQYGLVSLSQLDQIFEWMERCLW